MFNKKGGTISAGVWFIMLVVYFIFFTLIVTSVTDMAQVDNDGLTTVKVSNLEFQALIGTNYCTTPRYYYDAKTGEKDIYSRSENDRLYCEQSMGVLNQETCNDIPGCEWINITTGFWFWEATESATCQGDINASYFGIDTTSPIIGRPRVAPHNNTGFWQEWTPFSDPNVCESPAVLQNKTLCDMFSCTWQTVNAETGLSNVNGIYSTVSEVFTFRYDFGFSNNTMSFIMNFLFVVLPLLALIVSIYFMLPLLH